MQNYDRCYFDVQEIEEVPAFLENKLCKNCKNLQYKEVPSTLISDNGKLVPRLYCEIKLPYWLTYERAYLFFLRKKDIVEECPAFVEKLDAN